MTTPWEPLEDEYSIEQNLLNDQVDIEEGVEVNGANDDIGDWGGGDLEAAYLKAMSALEAAEIDLPEPIQASSLSDIDEDVFPDGIDSTAVSKVASSSNATSDAPKSVQTESPSLAELFPVPAAETLPADEVSEAPSADVRLTPRQIIEACLFVGGSALTSKKLASVLRGDFDSDYVEREVDELNRQYAAENRPYEIRLGEGGYRATLREEFERIRHKVYGLGPKEVRLSQEALEVLAVVAYHQPIKQARVEELGKPGCGAVLRQLVRRELLAVERDPAQPREVSYKTTPRFLSLFGIRGLDELPRHEQVSYK